MAPGPGDQIAPLPFALKSATLLPEVKVMLLLCLWRKNMLKRLGSLLLVLFLLTGAYGCSPGQKPKATKQAAPVIPVTGVAVPILYYHLIDDNLWSPFHSMFVSPPDFANQMKYLKTAGYTVIPLVQIENAGQYTRPVIITFDDGYEDNYTNAYPILKEYNFPATVFLISGFIGKPHYLNADQILQMEDLVSFQDHTVTHRSLATLSAAVQEHELSASRQAIEALTGQNVFAVAYPDGSYNRTTIEITRQLGYKYAFLMVPGGIYHTGEDPYTIKRVNIARGLDLNGFIKKIQGLK
jgi:peptidoglycan/xylan/chitin deacetylase (PgdA/CDA1 family)